MEVTKSATEGTDSATEGIDPAHEITEPATEVIEPLPEDELLSAALPLAEGNDIIASGYCGG